MKPIHLDPFAYFADWFAQAQSTAGLTYPNAMQLATVGSNGRPSLRTVLMKDFSQEGFVFFTNYTSRKGRELGHSAHAALHFYWEKLDRQVRIEGIVEKVSREESADYFHTRPRMSQISAWASHQTEEIPSKAFLEERVQMIEKKFKDVKEIPLPEFWGGYLLKPDSFEFWQQGDFRLHDRFQYQLTGGKWRVARLSP